MKSSQREDFMTERHLFTCKPSILWGIMIMLLPFATKRSARREHLKSIITPMSPILQMSATTLVTEKAYKKFANRSKAFYRTRSPKRKRDWHDSSKDCNSTMTIWVKIGMPVTSFCLKM